MSERRVTPERFKAALMALHNAKTRVIGMGLEAANPAELVYLVQEYLEDALHDLQLVDAENGRLRRILTSIESQARTRSASLGYDYTIILDNIRGNARAALKEPAP